MAEADRDRRDHPLRRVDDLYRLLVDNIQDYAIFLLDTGGHIATWNVGAQRMKGYTDAEIIGEHYGVFYTPEAAAEDAPRSHLEKAAAEDRYEGEGWRVRKDGSRFWAHVVITALRDDAGALVGFGKITGNKTVERLAQEALLGRERQLAEAQSIAHLGSWEYQVGEDRVTWSDELYRIFGVTTGRPMDLTAYAERLHPEDRERVLAEVRRALESGEPFAFEHRVMRPGGDVRHVQSRGEAVSGPDGAVVRLVGTALDITDLKRAEERERVLAAERVLRSEAEQTARRMGFLAEASQILGSSLEYEQTLRNVARLAVPEFADWSTVDMVGADGTPRRLAVAHVDPERVALAWELYDRYPPSPDDPGEGVYRVLRTGQAQIIPALTPHGIDALARDATHARMLHELGLRSALLVPIRVRDRTLGVITFVMAESGRPYEEDDLAIARELAVRAGLAIENAQLHAAERDAREAAERAGERTARLQAITAGLSEAVTPSAVAEVIVEQGVAALGAAHGSLMLKTEEGDALEVVQSRGLPTAVLEPFRRVGLHDDLPVAEAVRTGEVVLMETAEERDRRFPALREVRRQTGTRAMAAVPLRSGGRLIGGLGFGYAEERTFSADDREFLASLGRQCAQALERAWLYETEHRAREAAEAASRAKSQFVAMVSHELRTPLSAIIGYQELLADEIVGPVNAQQKQHLGRIRASASHLRDLINEIISLSRIEAGKEEILRQEVDVSRLLEEVLLLAEQEAESQGLELIHRPSEDPVELVSDASKLRQILLNLVANAIKFTDAGSVTVEAATAGDDVVVTVRDTGVGIAAEDHARIFEPFTQVDQSMTRRAGGSGLGLPVSLRLARLLGGDIELESEPGTGSTFRVRLPRRPDPGEVTPDPAAPPSRSTGSRPRRS
ncbi:MAG TPA: ATP-binding protein [Longimicrobiales bacterium]|nr:ATP-binding protein [Longimicrobiales bacterium]